jgi:FKBP-type peptidyl-prolyl cis-trans isomerase
MRITAHIIILLLLINSSSTNQAQKEVTTKSGLRFTVLKTGDGEICKTGQEVAIYESMGYLNGKNFYSIERPAPPIKFILGKKQVIDGVEEGVTGMRVGEIRKLIVPPSLSKRQDYPSYLSPDSTLLYKIELVEITKKN